MSARHPRHATADAVQVQPYRPPLRRDHRGRRWTRDSNSQNNPVHDPPSQRADNVLTILNAPGRNNAPTTSRHTSTSQVRTPTSPLFLSLSEPTANHPQSPGIARGKWFRGSRAPDVMVGALDPG